MKNKQLILGIFIGMVSVAVLFLGYTFYKEISLVNATASQTAINTKDIKSIADFINNSTKQTPPEAGASSK